MTQSSSTFVRSLTSPKSEYNKYIIHQFSDNSVSIINKSSLSEAEKQVLLGLLECGNIMQFPGGIGLDYKAPFKTLYIPSYMKAAREKIAKEIQKRNANCIVGPDISALFWARDLSFAASDMPIIRVQKDGKQSKSDYQASLTSYTKGSEDVLYFDTVSLKHALKKHNNSLRLFLADEIADTGKMLELLCTLIQNMQNDGIDVTVVGAGVIIEKTYTQAKELLHKNFNIPLFSALSISDMWLANEKEKISSAIVVKGISDKAFAFKNQ